MEKMMPDVKKIRIGMIRKSLCDDMGLFKLHVCRFEDYLEKEEKELLGYHEKTTEGFTDEEKNEYYDFYGGEDHWLLIEVFPNIQRKSELIGLFTLLEHHLNLLCSIYEQNSNCLKKLSDIKPNGKIDGAKEYLVKVIGIKFPSNHKTWSEIKTIQKIRNVFVHNNGELKGNKDVTIQYIKKSPFLELDASQMILIKKGFTEHCLTIFREFFDELYRAVDQYENTKNWRDG